MADVTITFKDGSKREFPDHGAPGGSYEQTVDYKGAFLVIKHAAGGQTLIPASDISEVYVASDLRSW